MISYFEFQPLQLSRNSGQKKGEKIEGQKSKILVRVVSLKLWQLVL